MVSWPHTEQRHTDPEAVETSVIMESRRAAERTRLGEGTWRFQCFTQNKVWNYSVSFWNFSSAVCHGMCLERVAKCLKFMDLKVDSDKMVKKISPLARLQVQVHYARSGFWPILAYFCPKVLRFSCGKPLFLWGNTWNVQGPISTTWGTFEPNLSPAPPYNSLFGQKHPF